MDLDPQTWQEVRRVFLEVVTLPATERAAALRRACDGHPEWLAEVERLLKADAGSSRVLDDVLLSAGLPAVEEATAVGPTPEHVGSARVVGMVGEGSFGIIYKGEQERPHRTVAIKVLRPGIASRSAVRRFQLEPELLARLTHPGIAQVYEVGVLPAPDARPYFIMEYVPGAALSEWSAANPLQRRVSIMAEVCRAVQHAHANQVVHRDLKPTNILVTPEGRPKVLDFGIARLLDAPSAGATVATAAGQVMGTLAYMSPEQAGGQSATVDARTDVYSLAAVLHELVAGKPPINVEGMPVHEAVVAIRERAPALLHEIARDCPYDLSLIVGKALAKEPERRYQTASELAADLERFLAGEAIVARPPSLVYQLRKLARRHRTPVFGAAALLVVGAAGVVAATSHGRELAAREREVASYRQTSDVLKDIVRSTLAVPTVTGQTLTESFFGFPSEPIESSPEIERNRAIKIRLLQEAVRYERLAEPKPGLELAKIQVELSVALHAAGRKAEGLEAAREAAAAFETLDGRDALSTACVLYNLGYITSDSTEQERCFALAAPIFESQPSDSDGEYGAEGRITLNAYSNLGQVRFHDLKKFPEAYESLGKAFEIVVAMGSPEEFSAAYTAHNYSLAGLKARRYDQRVVDAARLFYDYCTKHDDPNAGTAFFNLTRVYIHAGRFESSVAVCRERLATGRGQTKNDCHMFAAEALLLMDHTDEAEQELLAMTPEPDQRYLGLVRVAQRRYTEARPLLETAVAGGSQPYEKSEFRAGLGMCDLADGNFESAQERLITAHVALVGQVGLQSPMSQRVDQQIDELYKAWKRDRATEEPPVRQRLQAERDAMLRAQGIIP